MQLTTHKGSCHCGVVSFEVDAPRDLTVYECNCSMCRRFGFRHLIVEKSQFRLISGESCLVSYRFNTETADHLFCGKCGVKSFYVPRSHPAGYSVNGRCLEADSIGSLTVLPFDGANWEKNVAKLNV